MRHSCHNQPNCFVKIAALLGLLIGLLFTAPSCTRCEDANPPVAPQADTPRQAPAVTRCALLLADDRGRLHPETDDCPGLTTPERVSGELMVLVGADGMAYTQPLINVENRDGVLHADSAEGQRLMGLYVRLAQARTQLAALGWSVADETPVPVMYPFDPPGGDIPAEWRIDTTFARKALLLPGQSDGRDNEAALAPGSAARALATFYLLRRYPDKSAELKNEAEQRFARNARLVLIQTFGVYIGAVVAGDLHYMDALAAPDAPTPGRVAPIDLNTLRTIVAVSTDRFNPAPISMNLAACEWAARQSVRAEDRADIDREAVAGWLSAERLAVARPDPIHVLDWLLVTHSPGPRGAFCTCLRERIPPLEAQLGVCAPYRPEEP